LETASLECFHPNAFLCGAPPIIPDGGVVIGIVRFLGRGVLEEFLDGLLIARFFESVVFVGEIITESRCGDQEGENEGGSSW
jgi:hypothetical protein